MDEALLDTDIVSEVLKGRNTQVAAHARTYISQHGCLTTSALSVLEIVKGYEKVGRPADLQRVLSIIDSHVILPLDAAAAEIAGRIDAFLEKSGQPIGRIDPMIAGIAIRHGLTLVTGNVSHYERIRALGYNLELEDWKTQPHAEASPNP